MPAVALTLWGHALAALLFGMLAAERARAGDAQLPRGPFVAALAATALWALAVAGIDARDVAARVAESIRNLAWLWFLFALVRRDTGRAGIAAGAAYGAVAFVSVAAAALAMVEAAAGPHADIVPLLTSVRVPLRMMAAIASLVLVHRLYLAVAPAARGGLRLALLAISAIWAFDFILYAAAWSAGSAPVALVVARGIAMALIAPVFAVAVHRGGDWTFSPSRVAAFRSLTFVAVGIYLTAMVVASGAFAELGGGYARALQTAFVAGAGASLVAVVASPWLRAWARVKLAKHLFSHRYDYRHEWTRFTATLGRAGESAPALDVRVVQAVADLTDSSAGLLLVADGEGLDVGASWNWPGLAAAPSATAAAFARTLERSGRIVELDSDRAGDTSDAPQWLLDEPQAWAVVPLIHLGKLAGAVVLARPPLARALDWEDFDLLKVAGSQAASYLAEARAVAALGDAQRFDEFNRRFAFIIHDVKNLVSQLTLVARNAERHADNPEFRADMVATLKESCGRMNDLLARLSQHHGGRADPVRPVTLLPLVERVAARFRAHPVVVQGDAGIVASVDPARFEQLLGHLIQNAAEASPASEPVTVAVSDGPDGVAVAVVDRGCGMTPAFVRDSLFRPFASAKPGGFGIGAFEARQLATAMGGRIDVVSREGEGSRFTVRFPHPLSLEAAA